MVIAVLAIAAVVVAALWTGLDRSTGRAVVGALVFAAVLAGFSVHLSDGNIAKMATEIAAAVAGALIGITGGLILRRGFSGRAARLRVDQPRSARRSVRDDPEMAELKTKMQAAIDKRRTMAQRLVAGSVQLLDLSMLLKPKDGKAVMDSAEALRIARETAEAMLRPADLMVPTGEDGLVFLFDGLDLAQAEKRSQEIADAITAALDRSDQESPFVAKGFAHELDEYMQDSMIDSVEDLIRIVQLAHQAYMSREKGLAKELERELQLFPRPVVRPDKLSVVGQEMQVVRVRPGADKARRVSVTFRTLSPPYGAEIDCAAVLKLESALRTLTLSSGDVVYLPIRFETLSHPLYLENLRDALGALSHETRARLAYCVILDSHDIPARFEDVMKALKRSCKSILLHPRRPFEACEGLGASGVDGIAVSSAAVDFATAHDALTDLVEAARGHELSVTLFGVKDEAALVQKLNTPYSWAK